MKESKEYQAHCQCGAINIKLQNTPIVHATCHCEDCRDLLDIPFHAVTAWNKDDVLIVKGEEDLAIYKHPSLEMTRCFCKNSVEKQFLIQTSWIGVWYRNF